MVARARKAPTRGRQEQLFAVSHPSGGHVDLTPAGPRGYVPHAEMTERDEKTGTERSVLCTGLLMIPDEAGLRAPASIPRAVICNNSSCKFRGVFSAPDAIYERVFATAKAAGVRMLGSLQKITLGHLGRDGRRILAQVVERPYDRVKSGPLPARHALQLQQLGLIDSADRPTQAGLSLAYSAGWPIGVTL